MGDSRVINLINDKIIQSISLSSNLDTKILTNGIEQYYRTVENFDVILERVGKGSSLPFVLCIRVEIGSKIGNLWVADFGKVSFDGAIGMGYL